nr:MAG TPA: hypothetical protein [Caudoviricetes sp.]
MNKNCVDFIQKENTIYIQINGIFRQLNFINKQWTLT